MTPADFLTTFTERRQCFAELLELSRSQAAFVESEDYTGLLSVLARKQRLITRLEDVAKRHPQMFHDWRRDRDRIAAPIREACEQALSASESLLAELLEFERISTQTLARRRDQTQQQLQSIAAGGRVNEAYREGTTPPTHRHLDVEHCA